MVKYLSIYIDRVRCTLFRNQINKQTNVVYSNNCIFVLICVLTSLDFVLVILLNYVIVINRLFARFDTDSSKLAVCKLFRFTFGFFITYIVGVITECAAVGEQLVVVEFTAKHNIVMSFGNECVSFCFRNVIIVRLQCFNFRNTRVDFNLDESRLGNVLITQSTAKR